MVGLFSWRQLQWKQMCSSASLHHELITNTQRNRSHRLTDQRSERGQAKENETRATPPVDDPRSGQASRGKWDVTNTSRSRWPRSSWAQMLRKWDVSNATVRSWPEIRCWKNEDVTVMMRAPRVGWPQTPSQQVQSHCGPLFTALSSVICLSLALAWINGLIVRKMISWAAVANDEFTFLMRLVLLKRKYV